MKMGIWALCLLFVIILMLFLFSSYLSDMVDKMNYYIKICEEQNLDVRSLKIKVKNKEYERLPKETKNKLKSQKDSSIIDYIKNPIIIKNSNNYETITEKILQRLILEDIPSFLKELGNSFNI